MVTLPAISAGISGYPLEAAAEVAVTTVSERAFEAFARPLDMLAARR